VVEKKRGKEDARRKKDTPPNLKEEK